MMWGDAYDASYNVASIIWGNAYDGSYNVASIMWGDAYDSSNYTQKKKFSQYRHCVQ